MKKHTEERLEDAVVDCLTSGGGYVQSVSDEYDPERALNPQQLIQFISTTQPKPWKALSAIYGGSDGEGKSRRALPAALRMNSRFDWR